MAPLPFSGNDTWAALPEVPIQRTLDDQVLAVLIVLPIFLYPLLPSAGRSGIRCEIFLIWASLLSVMVIKLADWTEIAPGLALAEPWQGAVLITTAAAGIEGLCVPRDRKAEPQDFHYAAIIVQGLSLLSAVD